MTPPYLDPPVHGLYRRPMNKHFSVPAVARLTDVIDRIVDDLILTVNVGPTWIADYNGNGLDTLLMSHHGVVRR